MMRLETALISKGLRPSGTSKARPVASRDRPDFKGIKTVLALMVVGLLASRDRPDFKGIKTPMQLALLIPIRLETALISKGLRP